MKIVCISDTHVQHQGLKLPEGDVIVHCGDFTGRGQLNQVVNFLEWYKNLPFNHKIFIAGNHDLSFDFDREAVKYLLDGYKDLIYLENTGVEILGVKFWGFPYTVPFHNWAFMKNRKEMREELKNVPADTNVLISHGPPYKILDQVDYTDRNDYDPVRDTYWRAHWL